MIFRHVAPKADNHACPTGPHFLEQHRRDVAFGETGDHGDHPFACHFRPLGNLPPGPDDGAARDADRDAVELGDRAGRLDRVVVRDLDDLVDGVGVHDLGDEARAVALDHMGRVLAAR